MKANLENERVKRDYFQFLREAHGRDEATIDGAAKALVRFEDSTGRKPFKRFHREQAVAFKKRLAASANARTGERLSKSTMLATMRELRAFFLWLAREPGFKSCIAYADADYFNLPDKDIAVARARRERPVPTIEQVRHVIAVMPAGTALERRDRALIAFTLLTGARAGALASFRLGNVDMGGGYVDQDARMVRTKAAKSFRTFFLPIDDAALALVTECTAELARDHLWGPDDPLFPATEMGLDAKHGGFFPAGLARRCWQNSGPINDIFRRAFARADLPYFNPYSFRAMLVRHAMTLSLTPEQMKAWSQNLVHANVMTTLTSYGQVPTHRQGELIRGMAATDAPGVGSDQWRRWRRWWRA
jgi:integrase